MLVLEVLSLILQVYSHHLGYDLTSILQIRSPISSRLLRRMESGTIPRHPLLLFPLVNPIAMLVSEFYQSIGALSLVFR